MGMAPPLILEKMSTILENRSQGVQGRSVSLF
jgi:hypothetical protein